MQYIIFNDIIFSNRTKNPDACFREYVYDSENRNCSLTREQCPQFKFADLEAGKTKRDYPWPEGLCMKAVIWRMTQV